MCQNLVTLNGLYLGNPNNFTCLGCRQDFRDENSPKMCSCCEMMVTPNPYYNLENKGKEKYYRCSNCVKNGFRRREQFLDAKDRLEAKAEAEIKAYTEAVNKKYLKRRSVVHSVMNIMNNNVCRVLKRGKLRMKCIMIQMMMTRHAPIAVAVVAVDHFPLKIKHLKTR